MRQKANWEEGSRIGDKLSRMSSQNILTIVANKQKNDVVLLNEIQINTGNLLKVFLIINCDDMLQVFGNCEQSNLIYCEIKF